MEWLLVFFGGLLGSSHCVGMCGGFAMSVGAGAATVRVNLARQMLYSLGRISTYAFAGALAGFGGWRLAQWLPLVHVQAMLALVAGVVLVVQGLFATGLLRRRVGAVTLPCAAPLLKSALAADRGGTLLLAGLLTGLLPCGLVYGFLALASSTGNLWRGAALMALFGAGTVPLMVLTGLGASVLRRGLRNQVLRLAGACVIVAGLLSCYRGYQALPSDDPVAHASCPFCR